MPRLRLTLLLTLTLFLGCTTFQRNARTHEILRSWTKDKIYDVPLDEIWPSVRKFVFGKGYTVATGDEQAGYNMETEWMVSESSRHRLLVQGINMEDGKKARVTISRMTQTRSADGKDLQVETESAHDMEWALWKHLDPEDARYHEEKAREHADKEIED